MTNDKLLSVLNFYAKFIRRESQYQIQPAEMTAEWYARTDVPVPVMLNHLAWMCKRATAFVETKNPTDVAKAHRWLGYIQGELRGLKWFTIMELREHSREPSREFTHNPYPCCEAAVRVEAIPGDATTLLGGECPIHGSTHHIKGPGHVVSQTDCC